MKPQRLTGRNRNVLPATVVQDCMSCGRLKLEIARLKEEIARLQVSPDAKT